MAEPDDATATDAWSDFGQKVDLTARIREILLNYPEGTSILKELVQNAVRSIVLTFLVSADRAACTVGRATESARSVASRPQLRVALSDSHISPLSPCDAPSRSRRARTIPSRHDASTRRYDDSPVEHTSYGVLMKTTGRRWRHRREGLPRRTRTQHRDVSIRAFGAIPGPRIARVQRFGVPRVGLRVHQLCRRLGETRAGGQNRPLRGRVQRRVPPHGHAFVRLRKTRGVLRPARDLPTERLEREPRQTRRFREQRRVRETPRPVCPVSRLWVRCALRVRWHVVPVPAAHESAGGAFEALEGVVRHGRRARAPSRLRGRSGAGHAVPEDRRGGGDFGVARRRRRADRALRREDAVAERGARLGAWRVRACLRGTRGKRRAGEDRTRDRVEVRRHLRDFRRRRVGVERDTSARLCRRAGARRRAVARARYDGSREVRDAARAVGGRRRRARHGKRRRR